MADRLLAWFCQVCMVGMALLGLAFVPKLALRLLRRWKLDLEGVVTYRRRLAQLAKDNTYWRSLAMQREVRLKKLEKDLATRCPHGYAFNSCPHGCRV